MDFKELTKKDAEMTLAMELEKLLRTLPDSGRQDMEQDFDGFKNLFSKFIHESGPSVFWDKIEKLPQNAVSGKDTITDVSDPHLVSDPALCYPDSYGGQGGHQVHVGPAGGHQA